MEALAIGAVLVGSFATALVLQKAALAVFVRVMDADRRAKH